jgi:GNAT superfamily N-acetyltransferase
MEVRALRDGERAWAAERLIGRWGDVRVVSRGRLRDAARLPALVAVRGAELCGLATYAIEGDECELVTLDAFAQGAGAGTALLNGVADVARASGCVRLWLITTNDNLAAMRFYQRRGMRLTALHRDAVETSRRLKPSIPQTGAGGIPIRDELELELPL